MADLKDFLLIEYIANNKELYVKTMNVLRPEFFEEPAKDVLNVIHNYYKKYHALPNLDIIEAETDIRLDVKEVTKDQFDYTVDEIEQHCKNAAVRNAILDSADLLDTSDFGQIETKIRDALMVSVQKSLGIDLFADPKERLLRMQEKIDERSTGYAKIDEIIGNIRRGESLLVAASSGGGKSLMMANIANNLASDGLDGIIISLELNEELVSKRMDSIVTGVYTTDIFSQIDKVVTYLHNAQLSYGSLITKKLPGGSRAIDIRAYLMEYELTYAKKPDFIVLDYQDLMKPNDNLGSGANAFDKDKAISEELRDIWVDYNCFGIQASQLNRSSLDTTQKTHAHIAGGISKLNTVDSAFAIYATDEDISNHIIRAQQLKARNGEKSTHDVELYLDPKTLRISEHVPNNISSSSAGSKLASPSTKTPPRQSVSSAIKKYAK